MQRTNVTVQDGRVHTFARGERDPAVTEGLTEKGQTTA